MGWRPLLFPTTSPVLSRGWDLGPAGGKPCCRGGAGGEQLHPVIKKGARGKAAESQPETQHRRTQRNKGWPICEGSQLIPEVGRQMGRGRHPASVSFHCTCPGTAAGTASGTRWGCSGFPITSFCGKSGLRAELVFHCYWFSIRHPLFFFPFF